MACRFGGEEFLVVCPNTDRSNAAICAEKLRSAIERHEYRHPGGQIRVTASFGVCEFERSMSNHESMLQVADQALYAAKHAGRNSVSVGCFQEDEADALLRTP